jgi:hypothetical protein
MMLRENFRQTDKSAQSVYDEILAALQEMMPEQGTKLRDLARSLSEEYMRERSQAFEEMRPKHPEAPMTEQMIVEQAYYDQKDQERREDRMKRRLEDLQRRDAKGEMQASRPLRPPGSAQGIAPSVQYSAPAKSTPAGGQWKYPGDPNVGYATVMEKWYNPKTGERTEATAGLRPPSGEGWVRASDWFLEQEGATTWEGVDPQRIADWQKQYESAPVRRISIAQPTHRQTASNQPAVPRMQGTDTYGHAMMLDRMQDPYADPMHLQRMRQSEAAAARSGGYPRPTQPSFGPIERTYRA